MGPHALAQGFGLFQIDQNIIFLYLVIHEKSPIDTDITL